VSTVNVTLHAFAAECRAAAPMLLGAGHAAIDRYFLPAGRTAENRRSGVRRTNDETDRQTDGRTPDRYIGPAAAAAAEVRRVRRRRICPAQHSMWAVSKTVS